MKNAIVTGRQSGLGKLISERLSSAGVLVYDFKDDVRKIETPAPQRLDILVNCAGVNKINWMDDVTEEEWDEVMDTNAKGMFFVTQHFAPALRAAQGVVVNIVSNAATTPMRASAAYNASKGAAKILSAQMAREMIADGVTVLSVSPNKLKNTGMSADIDEQVQRVRGWSKKKAQEYQLAGLLTGEETDPNTVAEYVAWLLADRERTRPLAGCDIPFGQ